MTTRHNTELQVAAILAKKDGYRNFNRLPGPEQLAYAIDAGEIMAMIEHKMAATNEHLGKLLKEYWILPA